MIRTAFLITGVLLLTATVHQTSANRGADWPREGRSRVCVLTDLGGDPDDEQSLMRFLACANMYDVEGIVLAPFVQKRRSDSTPHHARDHVYHVIDRYAQALPRLNKHAAFAGQAPYPSAEYLKQVTALGLHGFVPHEERPAVMKDFIGNKGDHSDTSDGIKKGMTPGSKLIVDILMKDDPRPVYFSIWGGGATLQQAIEEIRNNWGPWRFMEAQKEELLDKIRIWSIDGQDFSAPLFFEVEPQKSRFYQIDCDSFFGMHQRGDRSSLRREWVDAHIKDHGPMGFVGQPTEVKDIRKHPVYPYVVPRYSNGEFAVKEGDTPAFLGLMTNGLSYPDDPRAQDWSGQYVPAGGRMWTDLDGVEDKSKAFRGMDAIAKWRPHFNADFQARMDWMNTDDPAKANHHPRPAFRGQAHPNNAPVLLVVNPSHTRTIVLSAERSTDPDGHALRYHWEQDEFVDSYEGRALIAKPDAPTTTLTFEKQDQKDIHVMLTVTDNGEPNLVMYRRIIIQLGM